MSARPKISIIIPAYNSADSIRTTLDAVRAQTLQSFECIIVNDGSGDATHDTVQEYISETGDDRFILIDQENTGVGGARNKGIENARGKYIAFYDADDDVPHEALFDLATVADDTGADLVIGNMIFSNMNEEHQNKSLQRLTSHRRIHPMDEDLIKTGSPCNKLFKRSIIMDNNIRFSDLRRAEDLLFCIEYYGKCELIAPCQSVVYIYKRRPYWKEASLTQRNDMQTYRDVVDAQEACLRAITANYEGFKAKIEPGNEIALAELDNQYGKLMSKMYCRFVKTNFLDEIYRFIWVTEPEVLELIHDRLEMCREHTYPYDWETEVTNASRDLILDNDNVVSRQRLAAGPRVTFAVSGLRDREELDLLLKGIYRQNFPAFEIVLQSSLESMLSDTWKEMENIRCLDADDSHFKKKAFETCRGKYLWFMDREVFISRTLIRTMYNYMERWPEHLFVSVPMLARDGDSWGRLDTNATAFTKEFAKQKIRTAYNQLDYFWINKLFRVSKLRSMKDPFGQGDWETLDRFYARSSYRKADYITVLCDLNDSEVLSQVRSPRVRIIWKYKLAREDKYLKKADLRDDRILTRTERFKKWKKKTRKNFFRYATVKLIYPLLYAIHSCKPVDKNKVLFVEPTQLKPTNSMKGMIRAVTEAGAGNVKQMSLGHNLVRKREQLRREAEFIKEFATARYVFTTEALATIGGFTKRSETTVVQLWHGCGAFKRFGFSTADYIFGGSLETKLKYPDYRNEDLITVSSPEVIWAYEEAMNYKGAGVVQATGISRTDIFYDEEYLSRARSKVHKAVPEAEGRKIILYAPTFRGRVKSATAPDRMDIVEMKEALGDEYMLLIKHHPHVKAPPKIPKEAEDFARDVTGELTIDDLICCADICISDYSSLVFEYSLFGKPMIFFAYDLDDYNDWRGFFYDYEELTPGPVVTTAAEIIDYISNIEMKFDREAVEEFRDKFMASCDGHATERILKTIGLTI